MMKKDMCLQRKMYVAGMRSRVRRTTTASEKWPGHDPIALPKRTEFRLNGHLFGVVRCSWPKFLPASGVYTSDCVQSSIAQSPITDACLRNDDTPAVLPKVDMFVL